MVKNEEDIIEAFVRHTLTVIDHLYVADNLSEDGTGDILNALVAEGLPLTVTLDPEQALIQNEKMTAMYRSAYRNDQFDFAFFLDADEFLHLDQDAMEAVYKKHGPGRAFYLPRTNYLYTGEVGYSPSLSVIEQMTVTDLKLEDPKSMIFHHNDLCGRFRVGNGNHHVRDWARGGEIVSQVPPIPFASISHFPIRSVDQYLRKSLLGSLALQLREHWDGNPKRGIGNHWHWQARLILEQNGQVSPEEVVTNLYGASHGDRRGPERPMKTNFVLTYDHLRSRPSLIVQLVNMYSRTIDEMWTERELAEDRLSSLQQTAAQSS